MSRGDRSRQGRERTPEERERDRQERERRRALRAGRRAGAAPGPADQAPPEADIEASRPEEPAPADALGQAPPGGHDFQPQHPVELEGRLEPLEPAHTRELEQQAGPEQHPEPGGHTEPLVYEQAAPVEGFAPPEQLAPIGQPAPIEQDVPLAEPVLPEQAPVEEPVPLAEPVLPEQALVEGLVPLAEPVLPEQAPVEELVPVEEPPSPVAPAEEAGAPPGAAAQAAGSSAAIRLPAPGLGSKPQRRRGGPEEPGGGGRRGGSTPARVGAVVALVAVVAAVFLLLHSLSSSSSSKPPASPAIVKILIPEGKTRVQIAQIAAKAGLRGSYRVASRRSPLLNPVHYGAPSGTPDLEGFLFPATYDEYPGAPVTRLVSDQLVAFKENFTKSLFASARALHVTPYQMLIVASMVEREAQVPGDRPKIAAVVYNRLRQEIPLGIDATIYYAVELERNIPTYTKELTEAQLHINSPYNTRTHTGLPPTPISNPGIASIEAAAHPARVPYLYYVAGADGCGEQVFSSSPAVFEADVAAYQAAVKKNGGHPPTCTKG